MTSGDLLESCLEGLPRLVQRAARLATRGRLLRRHGALLLDGDHVVAEGFNHFAEPLPYSRPKHPLLRKVRKTQRHAEAAGERMLEALSVRCIAYCSFRALATPWARPCLLWRSQM